MKLQVLRGVEHGGAKLTARKVRSIRKSKKTIKKIAEQYDISPAHVCNIRARRVWGWLQ